MVLDYLPAIIQEGWNSSTERKGTQERPTWSNLGIGSVALRGGSASETGWKPNASWRKLLGQLCKFIQYVCQHSSPTTLKLLNLTNLSLSCTKFYNILTKSSTTLPLHGSKLRPLLPNSFGTWSAARFLIVSLPRGPQRLEVTTDGHFGEPLHQNSDIVVNLV
jgi:hypothetical protein